MSSTIAISKAVVFAAIISQVAGHGYPQRIYDLTNGQTGVGYINDGSASGYSGDQNSPSWIVNNHDNTPSAQTMSGLVQTDSLDAICGNGNNPPTGNGASPAPGSLQVNPGDQIKIKWGSGGPDATSPWPHSIGIIADYMAACNAADCKSASLNSLQWFKIDQSMTDGNGNWAMSKMQHDQAWTTTIPQGLAPGGYVLKQDLINLDLAKGGTGDGSSHYYGPQLYPGCISLVVGGSGTSSTPSGAETRAGTAIYTGDEIFSTSFNSYNYNANTCPKPGMQVSLGGLNQKRGTRLAKRDAGEYWGSRV
ncbi:MAG: hypothetical protein Q9227_005659 [Pyrenula ochraceoflavens]